MNTTARYIFNTLAAGEVTISDFATLLAGKVTRQTLHHWKAGGSINDGFRLSTANSVAKRLAGAISDGRLPLVEKLPAAERVGILRRIILGQ